MIKKTTVLFLMWVCLLILPIVLVRQRDITRLLAEPLDIYIMIRLGIYGFMLVVAFWIMLVSKTPHKKGRMLFFLVIVGCSLVGSCIGPMPLYGVFKTFELFATFYIAWVIYSYLADREDYIKWFRCSYYVIVVFLCAAILGIIIQPTQALRLIAAPIKFQLQGVWPMNNANSLGAMALMAMVFVGYYSEIRFKLRSILLLALAATVLVLSYSRTSLLGALIVIPALVYLNYRRGHIRFKYGFPIFVVVLYAYLIVFHSHGVFQFFLRENTPQHMVEFSGRLQSWYYATKYIELSPFFGFGIGVGERLLVLSDMYIMNRSTIHNTFLTMILGAGIFGLVAFVYLLLYSLIGPLLMLGKSRFCRVVFCLALVVTIRTITSSNIGYLTLENALFLQILAFLDYNESHSHLK